MRVALIDNNTPVGARLLKEIEKYPLPFPEETLVSLDAFKERFEKRIFERLGLTISL
jgi:hypothetical protein